MKTATATRSVYLAVFVSGALFLAGQFPRGHALIPALHFTIPSLHRSPARSATHDASYSVAPSHPSKIDGPRVARVGSFLDLKGHSPTGTAGTVLVEGTYGTTWHMLADIPAPQGAYAARVSLTQRGLLHLRIVYPDGSRAVGSIRVR